MPTVDPFSANFRETHWLAFEWLSEIVFALAYAAGGWMGMVQSHRPPPQRHSVY